MSMLRPEDAQVGPIDPEKIPLLFDPDTPPCLTLYLPIERRLTPPEAESKFRESLEEANAFLMQRYGWAEAYRLRSHEAQLDFPTILGEGIDLTLGLFLSPQLRGFVLLRGLRKPLWMVTDYFYLRPVEDCFGTEAKKTGLGNFGFGLGSALTPWLTR